MVVRNLTAAQHITLADGTELYNGSIVLLADSDTIKYILHFGDYVYESTIHNGAYFYSIPDGVIVPAEGAALDGITVISNGHSEFPPTPPEDEDDPVVVDIATDDKSIEIADNKLKLKDFLTKYYKIEDEEQVEVAGFSDNLRPIAVQDGDSYKLAWIKDERVQEIDYANLENAENEYPSVKALLQDKLLSINIEDIVPEDLPKNVTLNALLGYENKNRLTNPNLWELSAGWYLSRGVINIAPETPLDRLSIDDRVILVSSAVVAAPFYVYVAIIMPTELSGRGSGASIVYCFYDKTSSDPEDFSYQVEHILTSGIMETDISETDNRIPTSLAVVNYVANKLSVTEVANPNLWELDTGLYLCSGDISVTEETVIPIGDAKIYAFINRIGEAGEESNLFTLFNMQFGIMYGYSDDASHGQIHVTVDDSQISISFDDTTADYDHIPTTKAVTDYVNNLIAAINGGSY